MADALTGRQVAELLLTFVLSFVIGSFSMLTYIIRLLKHGPAKWLRVKKRNERPEILDSDQYGTHHWMPLKVSRLKHGVWGQRKNRRRRGSVRRGRDLSRAPTSWCRRQRRSILVGGGAPPVTKIWRRRGSVRRGRPKGFF